MIRKYWKYSAMVALVLLAAACGKPSHESVMKDMIDEMNHASEILESVSDQAGAKAAASDLENTAKNIQELSKQAKTLGDPNPEAQKELESKYGDAFKKAAQRLQKAQMHVMGVPGAAQALHDAMSKMNPGL